jgi:hypothetical protein
MNFWLFTSILNDRVTLYVLISYNINVFQCRLAKRCALDECIPLVGRGFSVLQLEVVYSDSC